MTLVVATKTTYDRIVVGSDGRVTAGNRIITDDETKIIRVKNHIIGMSGDSAASQIITQSTNTIAKIISSKEYANPGRKLSQLYYYITKATKKYSGSVEDIDILFASSRHLYTCDFSGAIQKHRSHAAIGAGADLAKDIMDRDVLYNNKTFDTIQHAKEYIVSILEFVATKDATVGGPSKLYVL